MKGLNHLNSKNFVHRDIKPENILMHYRPEHKDVIVKISDFGLSQKLSDDLTVKTHCGYVLSFDLHNFILFSQNNVIYGLIFSSKVFTNCYSLIHYRHQMY